MVEFGPLDVSEDLDPINLVLSETTDDGMTELNHPERSDSEDLLVNNSQEYVHRFKDGTVRNYALTEIKKCPVASTLSENQLKLILKFSNISINAKLEENALPKPTIPDRVKVQPKTLRPGIVRPIEVAPPVSPQEPIDYRPAATIIRQEVTRPISSAVVIEQNKKGLSGLVLPSISRTLRRLNRVEPIANTKTLVLEPEVGRELPGSTPEETSNDLVPVTAEYFEPSEGVISVPSEVPLLATKNSIESTETPIETIGSDEPDMTELDDVVRQEDIAIMPAIEEADEALIDEEIVPALTLEELRGIDEFLDELIALSVGETRAVDLDLADPAPDDLYQELYYDATAELPLLISRRLEDEGLSDLGYQRVDNSAEEVVLPLDKPFEGTVDLTNHGTHEVKLDFMQKWLNMRTLVDHLEHVLGALGVYCAVLATGL